MNLTLVRSYFGAFPTMGVLHTPNMEPLVQTLERPWIDNESFISCIPEGQYPYEEHLSPSKGRCYKLFGVPDREDILIHKGNYPRDTQGCILVGLSSVADEFRLVDSRKALAAMFLTLPSEGGVITITNDIADSKAFKTPHIVNF